MNNDINVLYEDREYVYISFDKKDGCTYVIVGMNDIFNYENILISEDNYVKLKRSVVNDYLSVRVNYVLRNENTGKDILVGFSNDLIISESNFNDIDVKWIESYDGMTMSFISDELYDKYHLYEKVQDNYNLVCETEDFQVTSNLFKKGNYYYVEAYRKENDDYKLFAVSKEVKCECESLVFSKNNLSIVIPIYNSEKFLCRCVDSVLLSSFNGIELILVDDGSTDESSKIADWYHEKYGDIVKVIHKKNQGLSFARNDGIKIASSEYIAFLDSDDIVHPFMYDGLYSSASKFNLDIVIGKVLIRNDTGSYNYCLDIKDGISDTLVYSYEQMISNKIDNNYQNIFFVAVWNKIIKTSIVKKHPFPLENLYEDTAFTPMIYSYVDKFGFCKSAYYVWDKRQRKTVGTLSSTYDDKDVLYKHEKYCEALFYCIYNGNHSVMSLLVYDVIKEAIGYVKGIGVFEDNSNIFKIYKKEILKVNELYNLKSNPYIQIDRELYNDVLKILN